MTPELTELLNWIQDWMLDNDYECGDEGGRIFEAIEKQLHP